MATEMQGAMSVDFPLRGEWVAFNSPGDRVPSHGTDMLGQRFAYDFIRVDRRKGWHVHEVERGDGWELDRDLVPRRQDRIRRGLD